MAIINIVLDYLLIFGIGPFPVMGIKGAALASVISEFAALVYFILFTRFVTDYKKYNIFGFKKLQKDLIYRIIGLSYPTVFQNFVSIASWFLFFIIIEKTGEDQLAASNILRSLMLLLMFPIWGFAATANTMVGNLLGQSISHKIPSLLKKVLSLSFIWIMLFGLVIAIKPELLLHIVTDDASLIGLALKPLYVLYFAMFLFIPGVILLHTLIGTGDTRSAFLIELAAISVYLLHTYFAAIFFKLSLPFIWSAEFTYWSVIGILAFIRLHSRKWKNIRV
jgi:Na+-driven multidrug efflux pump